MFLHFSFDNNDNNDINKLTIMLLLMMFDLRRYGRTAFMVMQCGLALV